MPIDGLAGVILVALAVCVLAVTLALLLPQALSSAPVIELREWIDSLPSAPYPCACGEPADPKG